MMRPILVLTEADLIDYLVQIIKGEPPIPDKVRFILADPYASFLFLGFGFHNWYLRVLLKVLDVYGHRDKRSPSKIPLLRPSRQPAAIAFFSGTDRRIEFRHLRWEQFARAASADIRREFRPFALRRGPQRRRKLAPNAPCAFLSYASEDRGRR